MQNLAVVVDAQLVRDRGITGVATWRRFELYDPPCVFAACGKMEKNGFMTDTALQREPSVPNLGEITEIFASIVAKKKLI